MTHTPSSRKTNLMPFFYRSFDQFIFNVVLCLLQAEGPLFRFVAYHNNLISDGFSTHAHARTHILYIGIGIWSESILGILEMVLNLTRGGISMRMLDRVLAVLLTLRNVRRCHPFYLVT